MRLQKLHRIMVELDTMSTWATCRRLKTATMIFTVDGVPIVVGRNGTPRGMMHCEDMSVKEDGGRCTLCIHSERNALNHAAMNGVSVSGANLATLYRPCIACANDIVQAGIAAVYFRWEYDTDESGQYVKDMFARNNIVVQRVVMQPAEEDYYKLLEAWRRRWNFGLQNPSEHSGSAHIVSLRTPTKD